MERQALHDAIQRFNAEGTTRPWSAGRPEGPHPAWT
jgi:hypothetical protein